ncbi:glycosyltransferase [uncultured Phocaeicola sp.]|uniref:glycosyltransferase n=2 Tax=Bacteroidaceae TaxID=815 RepID=UPI002592079B|nr:glycosyltransferase [uncultured Phocaeicola sp.]
MKVYIKNRKRRKEDYMCFMQSFVEAAISCGIKTKKQYYFPNKKIENKIIHCADTILTLINKYLPFLIRKKKAIIITAAGDTIFKESFPYFYNSEIIPMLWDVWPARWEGISYNLQYLQCKLCFVTVRSVAERIKKEIGINAYWIPEGICITDYQKGVPLAIRKNDILELGRQHVFYHNILERLERENQIHGYARNSYYPNGNYKTLAFPKANELIEALPTFKIIVSFPRTITHPEQAGKMETLTQRYWEGMLSGCLIIGKAPQELIDLIGYNPVVDINLNESEGTLKKQIIAILQNISAYQNLVDKNYETALQYASWDQRMEQIKRILTQHGYTLN